MDKKIYCKNESFDFTNTQIDLVLREIIKEDNPDMISILKEFLIALGLMIKVLKNQNNGSFEEFVINNSFCKEEAGIIINCSEFSKSVFDKILKKFEK